MFEAKITSVNPGESFNVTIHAPGHEAHEDDIRLPISFYRGSAALCEPGEAIEAKPKAGQTVFIPENLDELLHPAAKAPSAADYAATASASANSAEAAAARAQAAAARAEAAAKPAA